MGVAMLATLGGKERAKSGRRVPGWSSGTSIFLQPRVRDVFAGEIDLTLETLPTLPQGSRQDDELDGVRRRFDAIAASRFIT
jgi:hypothetical protein